MLTFDASFGETKVKFQDRDGCIRECTWEEFKSYPGAREAIKQTRYTVNELEDAASQSKEIGGITENFFI